MEQFRDDQIEELLAEELSEAEVRELLDRLSAKDLGGSENATVGAVCEATGVGPQVIGRMLSEIRQENLQERFGKRIEAQERRLDHHERRIESISRESRPQIPSEYYAPDSEVGEEIRKIAEERIFERRMTPVYVTIVVFVIIIFLIGQCNKDLASSSRTNRPQPVSGRYEYHLPNGDRVMMNDARQIWVIQKNGHRREATEVEKNNVRSVPFVSSQFDDQLNRN